MKQLINLKYCCVIFITLGLSLVSLSMQAQNITLKLNQVTVQQAIEMLQKNYNYSVVIKTKDIDLKQKISINAENKDISNIVNEIFTGQNIAVNIIGRNISISKKEISPVSLSQQPGSGNKIEIQGRVVDRTGEPVIGAVVREKNTQNAQMTDENGYYKIQVADDSLLEFSFLGFQPETVSSKNRSTINVELSEAVSELNEVVVVGYGGVQKKSDLTGSVTQIKMSDYESKQALSLGGDYLRGAVAGLNIARSSSVKGQQTLSVRDQTSLSGKGSPLVVIDGMIYPGDLNDINPNDIDQSQ